MKKPLSEHIASYEAGEFLVTAAIWRTLAGGQQHDTFEIGIRSKKGGRFTLLQSEKYNHQSVQEVANVVATMLGDNTQCYTPEWCQEYLT